MSDDSGLTILHCIRAPVGGAFRHVVDLALAQTAAGHRVGVICDSLTGGDFGAARIAELAPRLALGVIRTPMQRRVTPHDLRVAWRLCRRVAGLAPNVLHGHGAKGGAYARLIGTALRAAGQRPARLYTPHGGSLHLDPKTTKGRLAFAAERLLERCGDGVIFVSAFEEATYAAKVGRPIRPCRLIHNGLGPEEFVPVEAEPDAADLLFIGELRDLKGVDVAIDAVARLRDAGRAVRLLIVGAGPDGPAYHDAVARHALGDRISFQPPMPIRAALTRARAVVLPSRAESLPYVVLETVAAGVPILATRVGGIAEVFGAAADRLLPPGDPAALAAAIGRLLDDPAGARADAAALRDAIADGFSITTMVEATERFYRDTLTGAGHAAAPSLARGEVSPR